MPHERGRSGLLSDSCSVLLDKRRALTITPGLTRDSCQTEGPYRIPRRPPAVENECVSAEMSKDRRRSNPKVHWTQLASNGTSSQSAPRSQRSGQDEEHAVLNEIDRRQIKIVLEDVLKTEIGQSLRRSSGWSVQLTAQSVCRRSERRKEQISSTELKVKRGISVTQRTETDSPEPNAASPSDSQSESSAPPNGDESSPSIEIKTTRSKRSNSETLRRSSEVSNDSCSQRESDSLQPEQLSDQLSNQTKHHEGSPEDEEQDSSGCESTESGEHYSLKRSPSSLTAARCSIGKVKVGIEHQADKRRNGEVLPEVGGARGSVLRLSVGAQTEIRFADEETPLKRCRLDSLLGEQVSNSDSAFRSTERRSFKRQSSESLPPEPIVLSSEEEEEREEREGEEFAIINVQTLEGAEDMQSEVDGSTIEIEQEKTPEPHSHITEIDNTQGSAMIEFQLSSVHMGGVNITSGGVVKITIDTIIISLKDEVEIAVDMSNVCKYSVWEGTALRGCGLVKDDETPPLSLLLLWVTDDQACCLHNDLSVIQPETCPAVDSTCVVLCLAEPVDSLRSTMLASLMELGTSNQGSPDLLSPLSYSDSLTLLQSTQETHLLQLLMPTPDPCSDSAAQATVSAIKSQDSDLQPKPVYTLCHRRAQGSYSISMVPTPGAQWTPYRHRGPARRLIQFPPPPSKGAITVTTEDLECLDSGEFLNDVIIDFYLKYLMEEKAPRTSVHRSHVFSSFFYKQLTRRDNANEDSTSTPAQVRRHQRVKTWTRHVDIFDKDFLFVPVNQEAHWYLVVICFPGLKEPQYVSRDGSLEETENQLEGDNRSSDNEEKDPDDSRANPSPSARPPDCIETTCNRQTVCKRPCILIMDSLKLSVHERIFKLLREYLQAEWEVKRSGHRDFSVDCMVGSHCKVPLQDNSSDCGLYLLQYAESFLQDPVVHFDLPLRLEHWFPRQQVRGKREEIRDLILHLYRFQHGSLGNEVLETDDGNVIQLNI